MPCNVRALYEAEKPVEIRRGRATVIGLPVFDRHDESQTFLHEHTLNGTPDPEEFKP